MRHVLISVASLLLGVGLLMTATGLFSTFVAVRLGLEGAATEVTGAVMSAYFVGLLVGARVSGRIVNRVGHIRSFAAFAAVISSAVLLSSLYVSPIAWAANRAVMGFCLAGLFVVAESWLNDRARTEDRGRVLSLYMIVSYFGLLSGQLLLPLRPPDGQDIFVLAALLFTLSLVPVALTRASAPTPVETAARSFRELFLISPLGMSCSVVSGLVTGALYGMGPVYAEGSGFSVSDIALFMGATVAGGLLLQWPVGRFSDRFDRRTVLTAVAFATALVSLLLAAIGTGSAGAVLAAAVAFGGLSFTLYPLAVAHTNDLVSPEEMVATSSGLVFAYSMGASLGPVSAAALMGQVGPAGLFLFTAFATTALGGFALYRMTRREPVPVEDQIPFVALPRMTPQSSELDPRAEEPAPDDGGAPPGASAGPPDG